MRPVLAAIAADPYFAFTVVLIGLLLVWWNLPAIRFERAAATWPTASGQVLVSEVARRFRIGASSYVANVRYRYRVGNTDYEGGRVRFRNIFGWQDAEREVYRFPAGSRVTVHYNPSRPEEAVLRLTFSIAPWLGLAVGGIVTLLGLWSWLVALAV